MKANSYASITGIIASLSYAFLFANGIGLPLAFVSLLFFVLRLITSLSLFINSKKTIYLAIVSSFIGLAYLFVIVLDSFNVYPYITIVLELASIVLASYAFTKMGRTKEPSPLDMPVYG
ncbi:MAG: hypothetical protein QXP36_10085 [Conexivisphaerales archaeon]